MGHKDLRLGQIVYILVFYNISFSWLLPLDGFQFNFLLRDSENDLLFRLLFWRLCFSGESDIYESFLTHHVVQSNVNFAEIHKTMSVMTIAGIQIKPFQEQNLSKQTFN